jgi:hypothetical protein
MPAAAFAIDAIFAAMPLLLILRFHAYPCRHFRHAAIFIIIIFLKIIAIVD